MPLTFQERIEIQESLETITKYQVSTSKINKIAINGANFVFSGELFIDRKDAESFIKKQGGTCFSAVTTKINYIIVGYKFGITKIEDALRFNTKHGSNIQFIDEFDFYRLYKKLSK